MTFTYRLTPAWMNPPSPSPPPSPPEPRWWDRSGVVKGREEDLGSSVLLWILLAIPALLLLHCCLVRGCFCYDDVESPRRTRGRLRARRRRLRRDDDDDDDPEDPDDSDVSDVDSVEPVSPAAWDGPTRSHRSGALAPFDARAAHPASFTDDNIHEWRALAMERARARAGAPTRPSPLRPTNEDTGGTTRQARARRARSHPNGQRRVSPSLQLADVDAHDEDDDREPGPMSGRAMATLPRCFVGDARWRGLRGLAPLGESNEGVEQGAAATTTDAAAAAAAAEAFEDVEMCLVCTDDCEPGDELIVLTCHHSFHADCIKRWLKVNAVCPACRARVTRVSGRERAALWRSRWGVDDVGDRNGDGVGDRGGGGEEIVVNVVG